MPGETIKERIDKNKNNFIDTNEINNFIFDQNEWDKNLNDLWSYLNDLPIINNDEIKAAVQREFFRSESRKKIENNIIEKVNANKPLNKKELSLLYLNMVSDNYIMWIKIWQLSKEQITFEADKPLDQICNWRLIQFIRQKYLTFMYTWENTWEKEGLQKWWDKISEDMFQQLLTMENSQNFVAKIHKWKFWETFVTWPYGMVYKHIDAKGNPLEKPTEFKAWEKSNPERAKQNAKAYYDKRAQERKDLLNDKWYEYNQAQLDSLVSASWWTAASVERLQNFVLSHREKPAEISNFMSTFATRSAWNWQQQPWLVIRRQFESNWFNWIQKPIEEYQREYYRQKAAEKKNNPKPQQRSRKRRR